MPAGDITQVFVTATTGTGGITSLASSSNWTAGYEWFLVDVAAMSPIPLDVRHSGKIRVGTTPTVNTEIRIYLVACEDGTNWPDVFDGTASTETITSPGVRDGFARLGPILQVDSTTSDRDYPYDFNAATVFSGSLPDSYIVFVTHNTGVNLNATGSNHTYQYTPNYNKVAQS